MISQFDHHIRKTLLLSLNEYGILMEIHQLSHNIKFGGWCIKSKDNIAEFLDLSRDTVFRAIKTLMLKELIEKNEFGYLRTTDEFNDNLTGYSQNYKKLESISTVAKCDVAKSDDASQNQTVPSENQTTLPSQNQTLVVHKTEEHKEEGLGSEILNSLFVDFLDMRRSIKKPATKRAEQILIKKLNNMAKTDEEKQKILENAISNSWQGFYPLKDNEKPKTEEQMKQEFIKDRLKFKSDYGFKMHEQYLDKYSKFLDT